MRKRYRKMATIAGQANANMRSDQKTAYQKRTDSRYNDNSKENDREEKTANDKMLAIPI